MANAYQGKKKSNIIIHKDGILLFPELELVLMIERVVNDLKENEAPTPEHENSYYKKISSYWKTWTTKRLRNSNKLAQAFLVKKRLRKQWLLKIGGKTTLPNHQKNIQEAQYHSLI